MMIRYITEVIDVLSIIEIKLLELESNVLNTEIVTEILGYVHSIKGNSGLMEVYEVEKICSEIENTLQEDQINKEIISMVLKKLDLLTNIISKLNEKYFQVNTDEEIINTNESEKTIFNQNDKKDSELKKEENKLIKKDIRVDIVKLDKLFDLVGELITIESIFVNNTEFLKIKSLSFRKITGFLNKISKELQEVIMSMRMITIENVFNRTKRILRDLSLKTGKKVEIEISGQETEVDKNIIEMLSDPLMHLIRNAVDHGIESENERINKNKPIHGLLKLNAGYEGNEIFITLEDDGKGLDRDKIINKILEQGIGTNDVNNLSDREIWNYIFDAGFSTSEEISEISGRGVGLDVVKRNMDKIHGKIDVVSKKDKGTIFKIRIPLTLAIIEGLLMKVGNGYYVLPILSVNKAFRPTKESITTTMDGLEVVKVKDELFPVIRLHEFFNIQPNKHILQEGIIVIIESGKRKLCIFVDELIGQQQQMVVKGFDSYLGVKKGMTGCTILGNGNIGFILDVESILNLSEKV